MVEGSADLWGNIVNKGNTHIYDLSTIYDNQRFVNTCILHLTNIENTDDMYLI